MLRSFVGLVCLVLFRLYLHQVLKYLDPAAVIRAAEARRIASLPTVQAALYDLSQFQIDIEFDGDLGYSLQAGVMYDVGPRWFLDLGVTWYTLTTEAELTVDPGLPDGDGVRASGHVSIQIVTGPSLISFTAIMA